jgi:tyrosine-protein phosphatase non-receptor type 23
MYTYINENFLHAPSTDLSREVVKILVVLMEAQATEVFIETMGEKLGKSAGLKARVCMQASMLYAGVVEEIKEFVVKEVFIREWTSLVQVRSDPASTQSLSKLTISLNVVVR